MKKVFLFGTLICSSLLSAQSNNVVALTSTYNKTSDTITNTTATYLSVPVTRKYKTLSVQPLITKISGTCTYTVTLQGSLDNVNFVNITNTGDSLLATTSSTVVPTSNLMTISDPAYTYVRLSAQGTGTMAAAFKANMCVSQVPGNSAATANLTSTYGFTSDTVINTATNFVTAKVTQSYTKLVIQPVITKISGTAAGTVTLQGSNDGVNFATVNKSNLLGLSATLSVTNVTTTTGLFVINGSPYQYYRLSYTGSGTMSCSLKGLLSAK